MLANDHLVCPSETKLALYPEIPDAYPIVYMDQTDAHLPDRPDNRTRYMYFKTIARGGTCIIQSCVDLHLQRTICYKSLRPEFQDDAGHQKRFLREARVTAMLQHPNTIPTYELGRDAGGHYYFTMKLVHGSTLREILETCMKAKSHDVADTSLARLVQILEQVCHALHYAHKHGVIHRDIKPENVLIGAFGEVLVLDWGLAKVWKESEGIDHRAGEAARPSLMDKLNKDADILLTQANPVQGSPAYVSPEQLVHRNDVGYQSDMYSLGAILYEVLTLERMIPGDTVQRVIDFVRDGSVTSPLDRAPDMNIPEILSEICMRCVAHDPADRYDSMDQVIYALGQWLNYSSVTAS